MTPECYQMNLNGEPVDFFDIARIAGYPDEPLLHAVKKLLFAGKRGKKTKREDVTEAMESCRRWLDMHDKATQTSLDEEYSFDATEASLPSSLDDRPFKLDVVTNPPYEVCEGLDEVKPVRQAGNEEYEYFTGAEGNARGILRSSLDEFSYDDDGSWSDWQPTAGSAPDRFVPENRYRRPKKFPLSTETTINPTC